ncbi:MAG TPA: response regulator transcription factor [Candidatus Dormibacteraeota bacterium]
MPDIKVLIVEDHALVAEGIQMLLQEEDGIQVVGRASDATEAVRLSAATMPEVVLMDFSLGEFSGAVAAREILDILPETRIVFLSANGGDEAMMAAVEAGGRGYLLKTEAASRVADAIHRAADGEMLIPAEVLAGLLSRQRKRQADDAERARLAQSLTPREHEILRLVARGLDNQSIADETHISVTTVRGHVQRLLEKLDSHSKLEAVARAADYGLIDR